MYHRNKTIFSHNIYIITGTKQYSNTIYILIQEQNNILTQYLYYHRNKTIFSHNIYIITGTKQYSHTIYIFSQEQMRAMKNLVWTGNAAKLRTEISNVPATADGLELLVIKVSCWLFWWPYSKYTGTDLCQADMF